MVIRRGAPRGKVKFLEIPICFWLVSIFGAPLLALSQELKTSGDGEAGPSELVCPPCDILFSKLEPTGDGGKLVQDVKVQERGEPKSGTGFMFFWAGGTLVQTCRYLQMIYGEKSCEVKVSSEEAGRDGSGISNRTLIFEPALGRDDARCRCDSVERVTIATSRHRKHTLPVGPACLYAHPQGIDARIIMNQDQEHPDSYVCSFADSSAVKNYDDLWRCVNAAACSINDDWYQMAIFRDPRLISVSAFYHLQRSKKLSVYAGTVDDFVTAVLPTMAQWIAVRHILFEGIMKDQSTSFWYQDALDDPRKWHYRWLQTIGLQLPPGMVQGMVDAAIIGDLAIEGKSKLDRHQTTDSNNKQAEEGIKKFEDEVSPHLLAFADDTLRQWLPCVLLTQLNVTS